MKFNKLSQSVATAVLLLAGATSSHAATYNLGSATTGAPLSFNAALTSSGPFSDIFTFTLPASVSVGFSLINFPVTGLFNTMLTSASLLSNADGTLFNADDRMVTSGLASSSGISFTTGPTTGGTYYLSVSGISNGAQGGLYNGAISVAAVPEPETFAMLLAGLGVMGFIARRRNSINK